MRLIDVKTLQLKEFGSGEVPRYAILSHRWESEEVSFQEMSQPKTFGKRGFAKIQSACWQARNKGYSYLWVDTCCIDKTSSAELTEAINSMYKWYQNAEICFAYLTDIESRKHAIKDSMWLTRGWTLQELIAPKHVSFHDRHWVFLGTKGDLAHELSMHTGIPIEVLMGHSRPSSCSVAQRMSWAARRQTTRIEDRAYSLLGIFDVSMPMLYGEGEKSFARLQQEILRLSDDQSIFAWDRGHEGYFGGHSGLLATSPSQFVTCQSVVRSSHGLPNTGRFELTNVGLSISLLTVPWAMETYLCILHCTLRASPHLRLGVFLERLSSSQDAEQFARVSLNGNTVLCVPLQTILQDPQHRVRHIHVRPAIIDAPLHRWYGFRLHEFTVPEYTVEELYKTAFHFRDTLRVITRYSHEEMRAAKLYHPNGLAGLPPRPLFFCMPRGRSDAMEPIRGTAAIFYIPPSRKDKKGERVCWMKFGFDKNFSPVCILGRRKSLWGGNPAHLAADEDSYYDAEEQPGKHALLFRSDWLTQLAPCDEDRDIAGLWRMRDYCVIRGHRDLGLDRKIQFLRLHISVKLEHTPPNYPVEGCPSSLLPGMNVWTINVRTWGPGGKDGGMKTAQTTGELLLRGIDDIFMAA
ncbi:hypothetical protein G647_09642 [Cladophialophora carrionii CBS 160.54]|uniref:Uncharacterized protein n=1 Tax=Cladophialophora carrionii CBS 160.54 TaxID=1279043 RepID=V9DNB7_9EURO|nr:uncharacterized protein G647_09642 [Cladophialophora carrionii CBS 160.54]ETI27452.1 hypothetical protein G647_09642 [Cladophialophora carrionii CBS 160.54]